MLLLKVWIAKWVKEREGLINEQDKTEVEAKLEELRGKQNERE